MIKEYFSHAERLHFDAIEYRHMGENSPDLRLKQWYLEIALNMDNMAEETLLREFPGRKNSQINHELFLEIYMEQDSKN